MLFVVLLGYVAAIAAQELCRETGFDQIRSCQSIPSIAEDFVQTLPNGFKVFEYQGKTFRQLDLASYFFFSNRLLAHGLRIRHPYLLLASDISPLGSDVLEISRNSRVNFHISLDRGPRKPRNLQHARHRRIPGFKRGFMCYTNASPVQIAQSISDFSTNEEGYKLFKSNCLHFVLLLLRRFCGDEQVRQARRQLFNLIMSVGGWFQSLSMGKKGGRSHHLPVMYVPPESTPENDLRRELTSFDEILECISTDCHAKRQTLAGIGENIVVNDEFNSL